MIVILSRKYKIRSMENENDQAQRDMDEKDAGGF
jgi:hypothetical protein